MNLPKGWVDASLLEVCELHDNRRIPLNQAERAARPGRYPYYGANGQVDTIGDYLFEGQHILLAEDGGHFDQPERGVAYEVEGKFWVNNHAHIISTLADMPSSFICRALNVINWMPFVSGTTRLKLTQGGMQRVRIGVPPLPEQRRIVAKLDVLTARIARARAELDRVPVLAKNLREHAVQKVLDSAETGWTTVPLERLLADGPTNGWSPKSGSDARGTLTLKLTATTSGYFRTDEAAVKRIYDEVPKDSNLWLKPGDLLIQRANALEHVGVAAIYEGPELTYIYPDLMMRLRLRDSYLTRLVWYQLRSPKIRRYFRDKATGTAGNMPKISGATVRKVPVVLPPHNQVPNVVRLLDQTFARADRLEAEAARARKLLDRLESVILAKAFRGELVPQDPNDEPASVLLERIRAERAAAPKARTRKKTTA